MRVVRVAGLATLFSCGAPRPTVCGEYEAALAGVFSDYGMPRGDGSGLRNDCEASGGSLEESRYYQCLTRAIREMRSRPYGNSPETFRLLRNATEACDLEVPTIQLDPPIDGVGDTG